MRNLLALVALAVLPAAGADQPRIGAAVKFGGHLTGWFQQAGGREHANDNSNPLTFGPAVEVRVTGRIGIEASGLYRRIGRDAGGGYSFYPFSDRERGYNWEFPVVVKYRLPVRWKDMRPFAAAGYAFEWERTHTDWTATTTVANPDGGFPSFVPIAGKRADSGSNAGFTAGFGLEPRIGRGRLIIEGRYTHWFLESSGIVRTGGGSCTTLRCVEPHQGVLLLGIGF